MPVLIDWSEPGCNFMRRTGFYNIIQGPGDEPQRVELPVRMVQWSGFTGKDGRFWEPIDIRKDTLTGIKKVDTMEQHHPGMRLFQAWDLDDEDITLHSWSHWPL